MKYLLILLTLLTYNAEAQSEEENVKSVVTALFDGMRRSDSTALKAVFAPGAILQTIATSKDGKAAVRTDVVANFISAVSKPQGVILDERISFGSVLIDGPLASVWTPYKFYVGDKFSHCGVNSFQLVKLDGAWKIQYLIDTRRKDVCN